MLHRPATSAVNPPTRQSTGMSRLAGPQPPSAGMSATAIHRDTSNPSAPLIDREQHAFGQQLPDDARARRADGDAHRHLAAAGASACEQQVRDVGARDEQHDPHHGAHRLQGIAHRLAALELSPRARTQIEARQVRRLHVRPRGGDALLQQEIERRFRPGGIDARLEAPHHQHPPERGVLRRLVRVGLNQPAPHRQRQRDVRRVADLQRAFEPARGHARDRHRDAVDDERLADRVRRPREAPLPVGVADHRDGRRIRTVVGRQQRPARRRRHPEHVEVVARHELGAGDFRAAVARQVDPGELGEPEDVGVGRGPGAQRLEGREGKRRAEVVASRCRCPARTGSGTGGRVPEVHRSTTSSSGDFTGSLRNSTASARLNTPAAAPMPTASDSTDTAVNIGERRSRRRP